MVTVSQICGGWWKPSQQTNPWPCLPVAASREWSYVHSYMCVWVSYIHSYVCVCVYTQSLSHVWPLESGVIYIVICVCVCVCVCTQSLSRVWPLESGAIYIVIYIYVCVCVCACTQSLSCVWLFVTPWTVACQAPLSMGFSRHEYWRGVAISSSRGSSQARDQTLICVQDWQVDSLPLGSICIYIKSACSGGDPGLIPGPGRSPGEGHGYPLQYSCLVNDNSQTCLSDRHTHTGAKGTRRLHSGPSQPCFHFRARWY